MDWLDDGSFNNEFITAEKGTNSPNGYNWILTYLELDYDCLIGLSILTVEIFVEI